MQLSLIIEAPIVEARKAIDPSKFVAHTLHLNYPDASKTSQHPWIMYLGARHKLRRPGRSRVQRAKAITYICGIELDPQKHPRIIEILRHRIPDIYSQPDTKSRCQRAIEILKAFGGLKLVKELYRTYVKEPGMIGKSGRKPSEHRGIVGSKSGADLTYLPLKQIEKIWKHEEVPPEYKEISDKFPKALHPTLEPVKTPSKPLDMPHVPTMDPYQEPTEPVAEPTPEVIEPMPDQPIAEPAPDIETPEDEEEVIDEPNPNAQKIKKFTESRTIGRAQSSQKTTQNRTCSSPSRQRRNSTSSPSRRIK